MCVSCIQTQTERNEREQYIIQQAAKLARENNTTFGVYTDEYGIQQIARADTPGLPFQKYISPFMPDA